LSRVPGLLLDDLRMCGPGEPVSLGWMNMIPGCRAWS
jgi:hypothetical protein